VQSDGTRIPKPSSTAPLTFPTPTVEPTVPESSAARSSASAVARSSAAAIAHSSAAGGSSSAAGAALFAEGVPDAQHGSDDDEFNESEPSLDDLIKQAPVFRAQLVSMIHTLDSWNSLVGHYKAAKKSKKD
jgi:hypothetical protein